MNYDLDQWLQTVERLDMNDNLQKTFEREFYDLKHDDKTTQSVLDTVIKMKNPSESEKAYVNNILRQANQDVSQKEVFK